MNTTILVAIILTTLLETPEGAPNGVMYAGMMAQGCTFDQWTNVIVALKGNGHIRESHNVLSLTDSGKVLAQTIEDKLAELRNKPR